MTNPRQVAFIAQKYTKKLMLVLL